MEKAKQEFQRVVNNTVNDILAQSRTYGEALSEARKFVWRQDRFEQLVGKEVERELNERQAKALISRPEKHCTHDQYMRSETVTNIDRIARPVGGGEHFD